MLVTSNEAKPVGLEYTSPTFGAQSSTNKYTSGVDRYSIGLPTVPEWPGQSRNWLLASLVPGWVTFVPEFTDSSLDCFGATFWGSVLPILAKIPPEIEDRFYVKTSFSLVFSDITSFQRKIMKSETNFKWGPFLFWEITMSLGQKLRCFICLACQYFWWAKMALGLKRFNAPVLRCPGMAKQKVGNPSYNIARVTNFLFRHSGTP